jgi:hypothetical protein
VLKQVKPRTGRVLVRPAFCMAHDSIKLEVATHAPATAHMNKLRLPRRQATYMIRMQSTQ